jgi:hypothetical protein
MKRRKNFDKILTFAQMKAVEESWREDLFAGINQFEYEDEEGYSCKWPILYHEQRGILGVYLAKHRALKKLLPNDPTIRPVQILPGISLVIICALENRKTDIGPYNSILVTVPLRSPESIGYFSPLNIIPGFEMIRQGLLRNLNHWFIWRIPDDSYISYKVGHESFGMPKFSADLSWDESDDQVIYSATDGGEEILTLKAKKIKARGVKRGMLMNALAYFYRDRLPMTQYCKLILRRVGFSFRPGNLKLELGPKHPMADELRSVLISKRPLLSLYFPECNLIIYEPGRWALDVLDLFHRRMSDRPGHITQEGKAVEK